MALPREVALEEFTVFIRAVSRERADAGMEDALKAMYPDVYRIDFMEACYNMTSARELVEQGVSRRENDRLFETAWQGDHVKGWVTRPVFVVSDAAELFEAWAAARQSNQAA